jgi:hypothetical protein
MSRTVGLTPHPRKDWKAAAIAIAIAIAAVAVAVAPEAAAIGPGTTSAFSLRRLKAHIWDPKAHSKDKEDK